MDSDERIRRLVLQLSGVFYDVKEEFMKRLPEYFNEQTASSLSEKSPVVKDQEYPVKFTKKFADKILEDLISSLLKESIKTVTRNIEVLNSSIEVELNNFKNRLEEKNKRLTSALSDRNMLIKKLLIKDPKFKLLGLLEELKEADLKTLKAKLRLQTETIMMILRVLRREGYIQISRKDGMPKIFFKNAPWNYKIDS